VGTTPAAYRRRVRGTGSTDDVQLEHPPSSLGEVGLEVTGGQLRARTSISHIGAR
jgi:hypothetical protein